MAAASTSAVLPAPVFASAMNAPIPLPLIRPVRYPVLMLRMSAMDEASRIPVAMNGAAPGSARNLISASRPNPKARSVSRATGSVSSSP